MSELQSHLIQRKWHHLTHVITAHVVMLGEEGVLDDDARDALLTSLDNVARGTPAVSALVELLTEFDSRLDAVSPPGVNGASLVGRNAADVTATVARLILRDNLLDLDAKLDEVRATLILLAANHTVSLLPAFSHGRPAQPTTLGHYLGGILGPLERAATELRETYAVVNRSPMGAGALAATAIAVDRGDEARLLGFAGMLDNTFDAVAAVDHFARCSRVTASIGSIIARFVRDILIWWRSEPAAFRVTDEWLRHEPGLPQMVAPYGIEALAQRAKRISIDAGVVQMIVDDTDYTPATGIIDELLLRIDDLVTETNDILGKFAELMREGLEFNRALLANRAGRAFSTISDLAEFLMIEEQLEPASARAIAALTYTRATEYNIEASGITSEIIDGAAMLAIGRELKVEFETISRYLAPRRFIERRSSPGGPAPNETRLWLEQIDDKLANDRQWREMEDGRLTGIYQQLDRSLVPAQ